MKRIIKISLSLLASLSFLTSAAPTLAQDLNGDKNPVVIVLHSEIVAEDAIVRIDQIAKVSGGSTILRQRIAKLDIAELKLGADHVTVTNDQVRFRLLLASIDPTRFRLSGSKRTVIVESDEKISLRKILGVAIGTAKQKYPGDNSSVSITPTNANAIIVPLINLQPTDRVRFEAKARSTLPAAGKALVDVWILVNGMTREVVSVPLEITPFDNVATTSDAVWKTLRPTTDSLDPTEKPRIIVKARDNVKLVVQIGAVRIEATGEAQEDGAMGQLIRVRNLESNRTIHGRVEARNVVLVD